MAAVRSPLFIPATLLLLLAAGFRLGDDGATWLWATEPVVALALVAASASLWIALLAGLRRRSAPRPSSPA